jgi:alkylation response protein AidB-like acyl-CoA dehydrogenase
VDIQATHAELLARAQAMQPILRQYAASGDARRRTAHEVIDEMTAAGLFRMFTPRRFGGHQVGVRTAVEVIETLGQADPSAAWIVGLAASTTFIATLANPSVQEEVFGPNPDVQIAGGGRPVTARKVDGGVQISGQWPFSSGLHYASWAALGATVAEASGQSESFWCLVPATQLSFEDTWHTAGMRATGSNTWSAHEVHVRRDHLIATSDLLEGAMTVTGEHPRYRVPFVPLATLLLVAPTLGAGIGALDMTIAGASEKSIEQSSFGNQGESVSVQISIAEAALKLQAAQLVAHSLADALDRSAIDGYQIAYPQRAHYKAMATYTVRQVLDSMRVLLNIHGADSFLAASHLQQLFRDASTAARHAGTNLAVACEVYGKVLLDIPERMCTMV